FLAVNTLFPRWLTLLRFDPKVFCEAQPAILAGFSSSSTPREEEVAAAALQSAVASFRVASRPS
ncbi:hypothetical protein, partial [Xanthomonas campestris]